MRREKSPQEHLQLQEVGHRLALVRAALGLTQTKMAEVLGVQFNAISQAEAGKVELRSRHLSALFERYSISPLWLLQGLMQIFVMPPVPPKGRMDAVLNAERPRPAGIRASLALLRKSGAALWLRALRFEVACGDVESDRDPMAKTVGVTSQDMVIMVGFGAVDEAGALYYVVPAVCQLDHLIPEVLWAADPSVIELSGQVRLRGRLQAHLQPGVRFMARQAGSSGDDFVANSLSAVAGVPSPEILLGWLRARPAPLTELLPLKEALVEILFSKGEKGEWRRQADEILSASRPPSAWAYRALEATERRLALAREEG